MTENLLTQVSVYEQKKEQLAAEPSRRLPEELSLHTSELILVFTARSRNIFS
jgi:hypothetical protein